MNDTVGFFYRIAQTEDLLNKCQLNADSMCTIYNTCSIYDSISYSELYSVTTGIRKQFDKKKNINMCDEKYPYAESWVLYRSKYQGDTTSVWIQMPVGMTFKLFNFYYKGSVVPYTKWLRDKYWESHLLKLQTEPTMAVVDKDDRMFFLILRKDCTPQNSANQQDTTNTKMQNK